MRGAEVLLVVAIGVGLTACAQAALPANTVTPEQAPSASGIASEPADGAATEGPAGGDGSSYDTAALFGTIVPLATDRHEPAWDVSVTGLSWNQAMTIFELNETLPYPADDEAWLVIDVTATNIGTAAADPNWDMNFAYVLPDGRSHSEALVTLPNEFGQISEVPAGETVDGQIAFQMPTSDIAWPVIEVDYWNSGDVAYFIQPLE